MTTEQEIQKAIERARRWDGRALCELEGCTHFATLEHVTAHIERIREGERRQMRAEYAAEGIDLSALHGAMFGDSDSFEAAQNRAPR